MGYRSSGAFRAKGEQDDLLAVIVKARLTYPDQAGLQEALADCKLVGGMFGFDIEDWKFYPDYPSVKAFEYLMSEFQDDEEKFETGYVLLGEESNDVTTHYTGDSGYDLVSLQQSYIATSFGDAPNLLSSTIDETRNDDVNKELVP